MAATLEHSPDTLLSPKKITLEEVVLLDLLLEIDNLTYKFGVQKKARQERLRLKVSKRDRAV